MKGMLSVSFGTSYEETRKKTIDVVEALLIDAFPDRAPYSAWTSGRIIARVRDERDEHHDTLDEAFARLTADGVDDLLVTTMCFMDGHEMNKIRNAATAWAQEDEARKVYVAKPVLYSIDDRRTMAHALREQFSFVSDGESVLFMGHGSPHASNDLYWDMQNLFVETGMPNFIIGTVDGEPTFEEAFTRLVERGARCVYLSPFMMVAGDHANNDLVGPDDDSWKNIIEGHGFRTVPVLRGLGEYKATQQLIVAHARMALAQA